MNTIIEMYFNEDETNNYFKQYPSISSIDPNLGIIASYLARIRDPELINKINNIEERINKIEVSQEKNNKENKSKDLSKKVDNTYKIMQIVNTFIELYDTIKNKWPTIEPFVHSIKEYLINYFR